jgi:hypothetical protein
MDGTGGGSIVELLRAHLQKIAALRHHGPRPDVVELGVLANGLARVRVEVVEHHTAPAQPREGDAKGAGAGGGVKDGAALPCALRCAAHRRCCEERGIVSTGMGHWELALLMWVTDNASEKERQIDG